MCRLRTKRFSNTRNDVVAIADGGAGALLVVGLLLASAHLARRLRGAVLELVRARRNIVAARWVRLDERVGEQAR